MTLNPPDVAWESTGRLPSIGMNGGGAHSKAMSRLWDFRGWSTSCMHPVLKHVHRQLSFTAEAHVLLIHMRIKPREPVSATQSDHVSAAT